MAIFARSGGGNLAALFAEQALEQGLQTLVIEPLREYNTLKELYVVVWGARGRRPSAGYRKPGVLWPCRWHEFGRL